MNGITEDKEKYWKLATTNILYLYIYFLCGVSVWGKTCDEYLCRISLQKGGKYSNTEIEIE